MNWTELAIAVVSLIVGALAHNRISGTNNVQDQIFTDVQQLLTDVADLKNPPPVKP